MRTEPMQFNDTNNAHSFIRLRQVLNRTGLTRSTLYAYIRDGRFPAPVPISERCVAWVEAEIDRWIADRIANRPRT